MADSDESLVMDRPSISQTTDDSPLSLSLSLSQSHSSPIAQPHPVHPSSLSSSTLSHITQQQEFQRAQHQYTQYQHNHIRSHSQPLLSPDQQVYQPNFDLVIDVDSETETLPPSSRPESPPHGFDMTKFLDFAVEASSLLEVLHQQGIVHGQLCPTSFSWEESSSAGCNTTATTTTSTSSSGNTKDDPLTSSISATNSSSPFLAYNTGHPHRRDNYTSPSQLSLERGASTTKNTKVASRPRRLSLTLDCTHLGLGGDGPRKGLRDVPTTPEPGSFTDPSLFFSESSVYSTGTVLQDAIAARVARIKRSLLSSHSSSLSSSALGQSSPASSSSSGTTPVPLKKHFLLQIPQDLHSPPGCVLPIQIDIYALGVMFYYLLTSHKTLLPEEVTSGSILDGIAGHGSLSPGRGPCLSSTPTRLANIIQRMVSKTSKERFLSMIQVRKELSIIRDQEQEALKKEIELMAKAKKADQKKGPVPSMSLPSIPTPPASFISARPASPASSTHSYQSTSTLASQEIDASSLRQTSSTHSVDNLSNEDRAFILDSVLALSHISNLQEMLRAISIALDNILVGHPPEEMAIILRQKDEHLPNGGTWAIIEDKFQPGKTHSTLTWTNLSERRDHMPVLVRKALDTQEPIFSTAVGSRSQLATIACVPIIRTHSGASTLIGAIYLHHLHPRFYFTKRDRDMLVLFCQKLAIPMQNCDKFESLEKQISLATQRNRFLEDTMAMIQKNEHEVFSWMEALPCFVWAAEHDNVASRRYLSRSWFDFTGLPGDTRTSDRWISAMHPDDVAAFQKEVAQSYKTGVYKDCEFRLMRYDGVYRWHLSRAVPVLNHSGAILKWVGVSIDIDDLYRAQKAELHKKSNFLANMSHELRTPFSGFHGMLTLLGYSNLDDEQQEIVYTAKQSCEKLLLIIDDLLDFSKLEADKVTLEASPFDLEEVFDEVENIVESLASQRSLDLAFLKDDNVPEMVIGDCNRLKQILLNLVGNAIKFTHSGHVIVRCKVLDRDSDLTTITPGSTAEMMDDDKFYFRHEKNGGGQCQSEMRPPNSGRFSTPEPLSENSIKLMFEVEDTGIGISPEEQAVLFSPFSQVDGSATRSYEGSGLGLSICLQLVKLMKGRIGLTSEREKGSTFWFVIPCEQCTAAELTTRLSPETDALDSNKEIRRITRTLGTPRILIASTSETTIKTLQSYLTDFNTEVADLPSTAASRLVESVANGISFDFVCWDFPKYDPHHTTMLELQSRPSLNNVHFVLLYTPSTDYIRRAQSLQLPASSGSSTSSIGGRKRPTLSQSVSLRLENSGATGSNSMAICEVPGLSPAKLNSLRITCISKPIRRLKLLRAFVEILDDSTKIHGANIVKKGAATPSATPSSPNPSTATALNSPLGSPTSPLNSSSTLSPVAMARSPSASIISSLEEALSAQAEKFFRSTPGQPERPAIDSGNSFLPKEMEQKIVPEESRSTTPPGHEEDFQDVHRDEEAEDEDALEIVEEEIIAVVDRNIVPEAISNLAIQKDQDAKESALEPEECMPPPIAKAPPKPKRMVKSPGIGSSTKGRSNSPKPTKASKLVTEEKTEFSLSIEEANRIAGMRILLAEDNIVAQKVLSKQLAMFGLVISCANDGAEALAFFKSHPRGYYTMGFFDHHMPNCDGVQATQQIRALEKEHAAEVKGPVPRLPVVAVSADIQETARKACLNSGMERYVTKPLMQKDLVSMVRQYCVEGDAQASTHPYVPPPECTECSVAPTNLGSESLLVTSTVAAMVSAGHVSAPIGSKSGMNMLSISPTTTPQPGSSGDKSPILKPGQAPPPKRELDLSPAALRGLALIRENTLQDESSKVGGGGSIKSMTLNIPTSTSSAESSSTTGMIATSHPMQHSYSHLGLRSHGPISGVPLSLAKSSSSSSLSASYVASAQPVLTSAPLASTSLPSLSTSAPCKAGPIAAMAASAAAAVAVASAAVNTMSSAISDHIHPPSIYAAQSHGSISSISSSSSGSQWKNVISSVMDQQHLAHYQQQQQQQAQRQLPSQHTSQSQVQVQAQAQSPMIYHPVQEVFAPYLHPCAPSPPILDTETASPPRSSESSSATSASIAPVQLSSWL
ncbi:histidine kinase osmosensor [Podila clonocystis]|nr:histidine kinase osmosensor [Podila clonocystis]